MRVEMQAVAAQGAPWAWGGSAAGGSVVTLRVTPGWYRVFAHVSPLDVTRLGYKHRCSPSGQIDSVNVAVDQRTVIQRAFACTAPGTVAVRTSVTGVNPDLPLRVQLAAEPGICDLPLPYYQYYQTEDIAFPVPQIGSRFFGPVFPGSYRLNLCGLPASCPTAAASQALVVREDEITDVNFTIGCAAAGEVW